MIRKSIPIVMAMLLAAGLAACRDDEQGRPLIYEKGVYGGPADEPLESEQRRALQHRGSYQSF